MRAPASTRRIEDRNPRPVAGSWVKIESKSNPGSFYEYHSLTRETRWVQGPSAQAAASKSTIVGRAALGSTDYEREAFRSRQLMAIYERGVAIRGVVPMLKQRKPVGMPEVQLVNAHLWQHLALQKEQGVNPELTMCDVAASVVQVEEKAHAVDAARKAREAIRAAAAAALPHPRAAIVSAADEARIEAEVVQQERCQLLLECDAIVKRLSNDESVGAAAAAQRSSSDGADLAAVPAAKRAKTMRRPKL